jgi:hypothetical protein
MAQTRRMQVTAERRSCVHALLARSVTMSKLLAGVTERLFSKAQTASPEDAYRVTSPKAA